MSRNKQALANKRFGEQLRDGFHLFSYNYVKIILPFLIFWILYIVIKTFILIDLQWYLYSISDEYSLIVEKYSEDPESISNAEANLMMQYQMISILIIAIDSVLGAILVAIAICSVSSYLYKTYMEGESDFFDDWKSSFNKKLIFVILILGICVPLGDLIIIVGIIIWSLFFFLVFTYNMKDIEYPVREAREIMRKNTLRVVGAFMLAAMIWWIIDLALDSIAILTWFGTEKYMSFYNPETRNYGMIITVDIVNSLDEILLAPLFICLVTPVFATAKAQKDLGWHQDRLISWGVEQQYGYPRRGGYKRQPFPLYPEEERKKYKSDQLFKIERKTGIYCPFCGHHLRSPKRFCPNCGEKVEFSKK
ncbi:MAG: zinc ribbon domain-containing protein [Promethearchaeota archaeon]